MRNAFACLAIAVAGAIAIPAAAQTTTASAAPDTWRLPYQADFWNYIGATVGRSDYDLDCAPDRCDRNGTGFKIFAGGKLYNVFGLELSYMNLGWVDAGPGRAFAQGADARVVLGIPLWGNRFGVNAKVGPMYGWTKTEASRADLDSGNERGWGLSYGAGATFAVTRNVDLRLDWDRYRFDFRGASDHDADLLSAGINYRF